jgi:3-phenylpropionate/trans-cinnamate dioxygenase ferredoxin reductase subunit
MSGQERTFVIVGASLTGARAAETLREEGFEGRIVLIGAEAERPYERPPLSKDYLRNEVEAKPFVHESGYYSEHGIELRTQTVAVQLDTASSEVILKDGDRVPYDRVLLATGAEPRRLAVPGSHLPGVHQLRTIADSEAIGRGIEEGAQLAVIGGGWIGSEVAASARQKGCQVTVIDIASVPLERVLGPELGAFYRDLHVENGVRYLGETGVEAIEGAISAEAIRTSDGQTIDAHLVVVGVGVDPRTELAERAGIDTDNGVIVDAGFQTSLPGVFAAGDVANHQHPFYGQRVRVEHWANASAQGAAAARSMLGQDVSYDEIPYFFSDQYDVGMEYGGLAESWDEVVLRGDVERREFVAFWLKDERVVAGMNVNVWDVNDPIRELIRSRRPVNTKRLRDPDVPIEDLVAVATS